MAPIQAVLFDFGQVLSKCPHPDGWRHLRDLLGVTDEVLQQRYWADRDDYDAGRMHSEEYWTRVAGALPEQDLLRQLKAADVELWTDMNVPMLQWVGRLHTAGFRTGILSNMPDAMAEGICARFDWIGNFDHAVWSHEYKMRKPEPPIYGLAVEGLRTPPEQILFIDDREENTRVAESLGMKAITYRDHPSFEQTMRERGWESLLHMETPA